MNDLLKLAHIVIDSSASNQNEAFIQFASLAKKLGYVNDVDKLVEAFKKREELGSTGFEDGIAIPHAQSDAITKPALFVTRYNNPVEWKSIDNSKVKVAIAILLPKSKVKEMQIDILKNISLKLLDKDFVKKIKTTNSKEWILENMFANKKVESKEDNKQETKTERKLIVGVSACTTGIAHTYMCKELLEKEGKSLGYDVHIECQGQRGKEYPLTEEEITKAFVVIHATDIGIDMLPFGTKKVFHCSTDDVVKNPKGIINRAIKFSEESQEVKGSKNAKKVTSENQVDFIQAAGKGKPKALKHLLSGCSYLIPFVVFAGLVFSIITGLSKAIYGTNFTFELNGKTWADVMADPTHLNIWGAKYNWDALTGAHILYIINSIANLGFMFMIPIMAAYIGFSIAGRAAMVSCFVTAYLLNNPGINLWYDWNGFFAITNNASDTNSAGYSWTLFGGIYAGFIGGYITLALLKIKVPSWFAPVMPIIVIPVVSTLITAIPVAFLLAAPFGWVMGNINQGMRSMALSSSAGMVALKFFIGALVGGMIGFDLGGPVNKIAVLVSTSLISAPLSSNPLQGDGGALMGAAGAAIPIAPMGSGLVAVLIGKKFFNKNEKVAGYNALILGFMGVSESTIPFLARDTWKNWIPNIIGSAVAGGLVYVFGVADRVGAWGGFIVGILGGVSSVKNGNYAFVGLFFLAIIVGILVHSAIYYSLLRFTTKKDKKEEKISTLKTLNK